MKFYGFQSKVLYLKILQRGANFTDIIGKKYYIVKKQPPEVFDKKGVPGKHLSCGLQLY